VSSSPDLLAEHFDVAKYEAATKLIVTVTEATNEGNREKLENLSLLEMHYVLLRSHFKSEKNVANNNSVRLKGMQGLFRAVNELTSDEAADHILTSSLLAAFLGLLENEDPPNMYNLLYLTLVINCPDNFQALSKSENSKKSKVENRILTTLRSAKMKFEKHKLDQMTAGDDPNDAKLTAFLEDLRPQIREYFETVRKTGIFNYFCTHSQKAMVNWVYGDVPKADKPFPDLIADKTYLAVLRAQYGDKRVKKHLIITNKARGNTTKHKVQPVNGLKVFPSLDHPPKPNHNQKIQHCYLETELLSGPNPWPAPLRKLFADWVMGEVPLPTLEVYADGGRMRDETQKPLEAKRPAAEPTGNTRKRRRDHHDNSDEQKLSKHKF